MEQETREGDRSVIVLPRRVNGPAITASSAAQTSVEGPKPIFDLLERGIAEAKGTALVTLVEIEGGSARPLGAHMAVLSDGRYTGYISGGCIEEILASEAMACIARGEDAVLRFGVGSPFFDVRLACGGSIEVHVHVNPDTVLVMAARDSLARRQPFRIDLTPGTGRSRIVLLPRRHRRTNWSENIFRRYYAPATRMLVIGRGLEFEQTLKLAAAAGLDVAALCADDDGERAASLSACATIRLTTPQNVPVLPIDPWTAVVVLFHDHDWETDLLVAALESAPFFIGAMGSRRMHALRCARLRDRGVSQQKIDRIKGPVGLFGPTRDATSMAASILADVLEHRMHFDGAGDRKTSMPPKHRVAR